jgi:hypothetical protein
LAQSVTAGQVNFFRLANSSLDPYTNAPTVAQQQWFQTYISRMGVFSPYFDSRTVWYTNGQVYQDMYAIYAGTAVASQHPEWILHDQSGNPLYIPWGCSNGSCPEFAGDIANPNFRAWWIAQMQTSLSDGNYKGLWIDDVNMNFEVSDSSGTLVAPIDDATGAPMTWAAWRSYVAQFMTQIRQAFPTKEIVHNAVWCAGPTGIQDLDPSIQAEIAAADIINVERGIGSDPGLTGGTGQWSLYSLFGYIDRVHAAGRSVIMQQYNVTDVPTQQYSLAGYFLISAGGDYYGDTSTTPDNWWSGFNVNLGTPLGPRTYANGVYQRNFSQGIVLLGEPGLATTTVTLPAAFKTLDGTSVTSVSLSAYQGVILTGAYPNPSAPAISLTTNSLPAGTVGASYSAGLTASGGSGNYTYSVSGAPAGLAISGNALAGTPTSAGTFSAVTLKVTDTTSGAAAQKTLSLTVYAPVVITTSSLAFGIAGTPYSANLSATGGSGTYTWSAANQPAGLAINGNTLAGTPSAAGTASSLILTATDPTTSLSAQKTLAITIYSAPSIATSTLPAGTVGAAYSASLAATGGSGNFSWSAAGLPAGVVLNNGTLSGTPTTSGTANVAVTLTDTTTNLTALKTLSIAISSPVPPPVPPSITTSSLPWAIVGTSYSETLTASGGSGKYTWSAANLPPGIVVSAKGLTTGKPTTAGLWSNVTLTVSDTGTGLTATRTFSISVYKPLAIATNSPPASTVGNSYSEPLTATGGSGSFLWSVTGLPPGITLNGSTLTGTPTTAGTYASVVVVKDMVTGASVQKTLSIVIRARTARLTTPRS